MHRLSEVLINEFCHGYLARARLSYDTCCFILEDVYHVIVEGCTAA
jgi:hypothetical protein